MRLSVLTLFLYFFGGCSNQSNNFEEILEELMIWLNGVKTTLHIMHLMFLEE